MNKLVKLNVSLLLALTASVLVSTVKVSAIDATFQPQSKVIITCPGGNPKKKTIASFENNAPAGSTVFFMLGESSSGGTTYGKDVKVGDAFSKTPELFWSIKDVQLGPWVANISMDESCPPEDVVLSSSKTNPLIYVLPSGVAVVIAAYIIGRRSKKR